ncbi:MAG TPA: SDR family oxidoreductase [Candidatus Dormibacteraeota bacterium]|nr:SDR family oxidoreductase [Candidatus Dormibacteraeota bacterium]
MSVGIIVGAGGGIGSACARALDSSADVVVLAGRSEPRLRAIASTLAGKTATIVADVATDDGREAIARAAGDAGEIAWLVLASGVPLRGPLTQLAPADIEATLLTNLIGPVLLIRRLLDGPWETNATIIAVGSISATRALPNRSVYSASKAGLEHFCRSLASEVAPRGIRVNVVSPGVIDTPFLGSDQSRLQAWVSTHVPQARIGSPGDVAEVVRYLTQEAPAYVTGARIAVDGGAETVS